MRDNDKVRKRLRLAGQCFHWLIAPVYYPFVWPFAEALSWHCKGADKRLGDRMRKWRTEGFTLIELSIVLVIIGLIVGGVLVGQDMIKAAETRATIAQIEKYNTAVNTFKVKFGYIPGDIPDPYASNFGFQARGQYAGEGDGNGRIEGVWNDNAGVNSGYANNAGETVMFWVDLSVARLIDQNLSGASTHIPNSNASSSIVPTFFPAAKLGNGNYFHVYSDPNFAPNYFVLSAIQNLSGGGTVTSSPGLTVSQAYNIDKKIDDGFPQSGNVVAQYVNNSSIIWCGASQWILLNGT